jgi:hypothetical protein
MGKSNNPAKRAAQETELKAKKSRSSRSVGFLKFILVLVLSVAICGPFFAGLVGGVQSSPLPVNTITTPATAPVITSTVPAPASAKATVTATTPAGQ